MKKISLKLIKADQYLNWTIAITLFLIPYKIDSLIFRSSPFLPADFWVITAFGFLFFAFWQNHLIQNRSKQNLLFAALAAWIPTFALALALIILRHEIYLATSLILWAANLYMLLLGLWYAYSAKN